MVQEGRAPLIALPAELEAKGRGQSLSRCYSDAVLASGGFPIIVPILECPSAARQLAEKIDGLILTGSRSDVDPARYSATPDQCCGPIHPLRDETDFTLLESALRKKIPVLGICFGMQSLNVFMGGTLIQDIAFFSAGSIKHDCPESAGRPSHEIEIAPASVLEKMAGGNRATVNSTHHQAVDRPGHGLNVIAQAPDGVIESVISTSDEPWILGVQWHPEKSYGYDCLSKNLFDTFVAQCRASLEGK
jgi:putative glutamine amidotransferase